jgi:two-component system, OmpR family, response regulator VicR
MAKRHYVIVVADDNETINGFLRDLLVAEGYQVLCCFTGADAERVIRRVIPDVAIVDMQMEVRDAGLRLLKSLRQHPPTAQIAVILCSADVSMMEGYRDEITTYGGRIIPKPFPIDHLLETIQQLLAATEA